MPTDLLHSLVRLCCYVLDMYPRRMTLPNSDVLAHVTSRCHNREFLLSPDAMKRAILLLWAKHKERYGIRIYAFIIMDNHFHAIVRAPDAEMLGHFMRTTNSSMARIVNTCFERDSQVFRERYISPQIADMKYLRECMQYIFKNRLRVKPDSKPDQDPFCSASWYLHKPYKFIADPQTESEKENNLLAKLLDEISELGFVKRADTSEFIRTMVNLAKQRIAELLPSTFEHTHSIGDEVFMKFRTELLNAYRRQRGPPVRCHASAYYRETDIL